MSRTLPRPERELVINPSDEFKSPEYVSMVKNGIETGNIGTSAVLMNHEIIDRSKSSISFLV